MTELYDIGEYADMTITIPANSSFSRGLVLGCASASNKLLPFATPEAEDEDELSTMAASPEVYAASPEYVLVNFDGIKNDTGSPADVTAKVLVAGRVNAYGLCFAKEADTIDTAGLLTKLKNNGIVARRIENYVEEDK